MPRRHDPQGPAKGILNGISLAGVLWAAILIALMTVSTCNAPIDVVA